MASPLKRDQWPFKMKNKTKLRPKMKRGQKATNTLVKSLIYTKLATRVYRGK